jgi:excisionase family DNA binding protein
MKPIDPDAWYSTTQAAKLLPGGYSSSTIVELLEEGLLSATRLRRRGNYRISGRALQAFMERAKGDAP